MDKLSFHALLDLLASAHDREVVELRSLLPKNEAEQFSKKWNDMKSEGRKGHVISLDGFDDPILPDDSNGWRLAFNDRAKMPTTKSQASVNFEENGCTQEDVRRQHSPHISEEGNISIKDEWDITRKSSADITRGNSGNSASVHKIRSTEATNGSNRRHSLQSDMRGDSYLVGSGPTAPEWLDRVVELKKWFERLDTQRRFYLSSEDVQDIMEFVDGHATRDLDWIKKSIEAWRDAVRSIRQTEDEDTYAGMLVSQYMQSETPPCCLSL
jgi:hypothetical protein